MIIRSSTLGIACVALLGGCFEKPPVIDTDSEGTGGTTDVDPTSTTADTMPTTTAVEPTVESTTVDLTTTIDPDTTVGPTTMSATETTDTTGPVDECMQACEGLVCAMVEACVCGECSDPMATCSEDQTYCGVPIGFFNVFPDTQSAAGQAQFGHRFSVFEPTTVRRLGVIAGGAGADVRLALYDHDGVGPATRILQTGAVTLYAAGNNEFDVGATDIMPGDYWVMLHTNGLTSLRTTVNGDNMYEYAYRVSIPFMDGFPEMMDDEVVELSYRFNLYMVVEE